MVDQELLKAISDLLDEKLEQKLEEKLAPIRRDIEELKADNKRIHARLDRLEKEVRKNSLILENEVLPRLNTIEQCYVESSKHFIKKAHQIEDLQQDVDVMKVVIQEHSEKLDLIS